MAAAIFTFFTRRLVGGIFGGLFFDSHIDRKYLVNVIHLYLFIFLLVFPLVLSWNLPYQQFSAYLEFQKASNQPFLYGYVITITCFFILIKLGNYFYRKFVRFSDEERKKKRIQRRLNRQKKKEEKLKLKRKNDSLKPESSISMVTIENGNILIAPSDPIKETNNGKEEEPDSKLKEDEEVKIEDVQNEIEKKEKNGDEEIREEKKEEEESSSEEESEEEDGEEEELSEGEIRIASQNRNEIEDRVRKEETKGKAEVFEYIDEFGEVQHYIMYNEEEPEDALAIASGEIVNPLSSHSLHSSRSASSEESSVNIEQLLNATSSRHRLPHPSSPPSHQLPVTVASPSLDKPKETQLEEQKVEIPSFWKAIEMGIIQQRRLMNDLLDPSPFLDTFFAIFFGLMTSYIAWRLTPFYKELSRFMLWFVVATAQYSLFKSPQPDPSSSRQDFNRLNPFSRSFYFCFIGGIILLLDRFLLPYNTLSVIELYGVSVKFHSILQTVQTIFIVFIPWYPLIHIFGLLPQIDTFVMYFSEQINIHIFGSSGSSNIVSSLLDLFGSFFILGISFIPGYFSQLQSSFLFSLYLSFLVAFSFLQSRIIKDPYLWMNHIQDPNKESKTRNQILRVPSFWTRLLVDVLFTAFLVGVVLGLVHSSFFLKFGRNGFTGVGILGIALGLISKWIIGSVRLPQPYGIFCAPFLLTAELEAYEPPNKPSQIMWFESFASILNALNSCVVFPALFLISASLDRSFILSKFSVIGGTIVLSIIGIRLVRGVFTDSSRNWLFLLFTLLFFRFDAREYSEFFLLDYFLSAFLVNKIFEILEKTDFVVVYIAPWNAHWGSLFHGAVQPLTIPHVPFFIFQILYSALVSVPMYPLLGSGAFFASWARPIRFWERSYNSTRVDNSQRKLANTLNNSDFNPDNLNSIFYEHLMISLRSSLQENISLGRLGNVDTGDFFLIMNDRLTAVLHIIEIGNGYCTFQVRGMEFKGTYCHERELEKLTQDTYDDSVVTSLGETIETKWFVKFPIFLSLKEMIARRWRTWRTINYSLMLQTYSISLNPMMSTIYSNDARKNFVKYYVCATIYYLLTNSSFENWLSDNGIASHIKRIKEDFVDVGSCFGKHNDLDYDERTDGISFDKFKSVYQSWIDYCISKMKKKDEMSEEMIQERNKNITVFCMLASFASRRAFFPDSCPNSYNIANFLESYNTIFKGDIRISHPNDEWVLSQIEIIQKVIAKAARMTLKLHQDQFIEDFEEVENMWESLESYEQGGIACCHESDPLWRQAILDSTENLLSLRLPSNSADYSTVSLLLRYMKFRVVKLNKESVRGLWAGQVQELVFFGNTNSERGSIQRLSAVVRNLINQSCDVPIGYPVYVSPLMVSTSTRRFWLKEILCPSSLWKKLPRFFTGEKKKK